MFSIFILHNYSAIKSKRLTLNNSIDTPGRNAAIEYQFTADNLVEKEAETSYFNFECSFIVFQS